MIPHFHRLKIAEVRRETPEAVSIAFTVPEELRDAFRFVHGQHVTVKTEIGGEEVRRSYSICSGVGEGELRIAVKKQTGGLFSAFANERLEQGQELDVMTPTGHFTAPLDPGAERVYLGIACGSGITPLLSIIKTTLVLEPKSRFFLLYGNRTAQSIIFREALEELKDRFLDRLSISHVLSREAQDVAALSGRLDAEKITLLVRGTVPVTTIDHVFLCGPAEMLETAARTLSALGVAADRIHIERFTIGDVSPRPPIPVTRTAPVHKSVAEAEVVIDGIRHRFPVGEAESIIEAALVAGIELPYSCRGGMCCTCRAKLVEGKVTMAVNYSLEPWELAAGYVLTCQSRPTTPKVLLDYDHL
jgi:ring-1,2-phenylacetyl-CoA epoxidase subunit PaaE